jgi:hypothetical protein
MVDPWGSGLIFFMFKRAQPYTCLGIECVDLIAALCGYLVRYMRILIRHFGIVGSIQGFRSVTRARCKLWLRRWPSFVQDLLP